MGASERTGQLLPSSDSFLHKAQHQLTAFSSPVPLRASLHPRRFSSTVREIRNIFRSGPSGPPLQANIDLESFHHMAEFPSAASVVSLWPRVQRLSMGLRSRTQLHSDDGIQDQSHKTIHLNTQLIICEPARETHTQFSAHNQMLETAAQFHGPITRTQSDAMPLPPPSSLTVTPRGKDGWQQ